MRCRDYGRSTGKDNFMMRLAGYAAALFVLAVACVGNAAGAQNRVVTAPYIELHTGPGMGFPVFQVAERGEVITPLVGKPDWFKVTTQRGTTGWVSRRHMALTEAVGKPADDRQGLTIVGLASGRFDQEPTATLLLGYRVLQWMSLELAMSEVAGLYADSHIYSGQFSFTPFSWRLAPYLVVGAGRFYNQPHSALPDGSESKTAVTSTGVGLRLAVHRRLFLTSGLLVYETLFDRAATDYFQWDVGLRTLF